MEKTTTMNTSNNPYSTPLSNVEALSNSIHIPFLKSWAIFALIATLGGFVAGFIVGAVIGAIMGFSGASAQSIQIAGSIGGFIIGLPISYLTFKWSVNKYIVSKFISDSHA